MKELYRKEKKFIINYPEMIQYTGYLNKVMKQDLHNGINGYKVRSLYFDTINDKDFEEKEMGIKIRKKIRLRIYDLDQKFALLEMKQKDGEYQLKKSLKLSKEDGIQLSKGIYEVLLKYQDPFAKQCYAIMNIQCYRPKAIVEYTRKAFVLNENNTRITFDHNIKINEINHNIFDKKMILNNALEQSNIILEVKYSGQLFSYIKDFLEQVDKSETSISKYSLARHSTKHYL